MTMEEAAGVHVLAVRPDRQRRGLGKALLAEIVRLAARAGKKAVRLDALSGNCPAQKLYRQSGFVCIGTRRLYAENTGWADFVFWEKALPAPAQQRPPFP